MFVGLFIRRDQYEPHQSVSLEFLARRITMVVTFNGPDYRSKSGKSDFSGADLWMGCPQLRGTEVCRPIERDQWMAERARETAALDSILRRPTGATSLAGATGGTKNTITTTPASGAGADGTRKK